MRPIIVHNREGAERRLNPMQVAGWAPAEIEVEPARFMVGTLVMMAAGNLEPLPIRESVEQFDFLFERASAFTIEETNALQDAWRLAAAPKLDETVG